MCRVDPIEQIIEAVIEREGVYVDHPSDRGGPTNFGITQATLSAWRGREVSAEEVRALDRDEAALIYRCYYVEEPGFDRLADEVVAAQVIDAGVLHGTGRAIRLLQKALRVRVDGVVGPKTRAAVNTTPRHVLMQRFAIRQLEHIAEIVSEQPEQSVFLLGWFRRATSHIQRAVV